MRLKPWTLFQAVFDLKPNGDLKVKGTITDGNGTTLHDLEAENQALRDRVADLEAQVAGMAEMEARLAAMEVLLAELTAQ